MRRTVRTRATTVATLLALLGGCAADVDLDSQAHTLRSPAPLSRHGRAVLQALRASYPQAEGRTYHHATDGQLSPDWLIQSAGGAHFGQRATDLPYADTCAPGRDQGCEPSLGLRRCTSDADCTLGRCAPVAASVSRPDEAAAKLCIGHSDAMLDQLYEVVVSAEHYVDVASLSPADGRFQAALRNAITYLGHSGRAVDVRVLYGNIIFYDVDTRAALRALTRDVPPDARVRVSVGAFRSGFDSWNHAKILAADGRTAIVGGHNLWTDHYLSTAPVHDISMQVHGSAAAAVQRFADLMWEFACHGSSWGGRNQVRAFPTGAPRCLPGFAEAEITPRPGPPGAHVITVGRLGRLGDNPADVALAALLDSAERSLRLSIQDLGPVKVGPFALAGWPQHTLGALARAALRGVDVYIALSEPGSKPGGLRGASANYGNGWTPQDVVARIAQWVDAHPESVPAGVDETVVLCERLHVGLLRFGPDERWPDGAGIGNHAKLVLVDDQTFYIGSQNLYEANLSEIGFILDDREAARELRDRYWDPLWRYTARTAVSGESAPHCVLED